MALSVVSDCTINFNVSDVDPSHTNSAGGDVTQIQSSTTRNFGASPLPTIALEWSDTFTLASTTTTLDLTALLGQRGSTTSFSSIRKILIINLSTTTLFKITAGGAANPWTPSGISGTWDVQANSRFYLETCDVAWVVDGTHKLLKFDSGAHTVSFQIYLVGS
jgi:hypothetical protein